MLANFKPNHSWFVHYSYNNVMASVSLPERCTKNKMSGACKLIGETRNVYGIYGL